ncbi:hypothetical protein HYS90_02455 [Candidatus Curtissbacteria bacterium]|nr:hypothetical protein [Candidatus Curtissbacteria bacterium]
MKFIKSLWRRWLVIAQAVGNFQAQVILTAFYLAILLPVGILLRIFADPLRFRNVTRSNFQKWQHPRQSLEESRKQY